MASYLVTRRFVGVQTIFVRDATSKTDAKRQAENWDGSNYGENLPVEGVYNEVEKYREISLSDISIDGKED